MTTRSIPITQNWFRFKVNIDVEVFTNSSDPSLDNRSDEREPAGFRVMVGIGTGW